MTEATSQETSKMASSSHQELDEAGPSSVRPWTHLDLINFPPLTCERGHACCLKPPNLFMVSQFVMGKLVFHV